MKETKHETKHESKLKLTLLVIKSWLNETRPAVTKDDILGLIDDALYLTRADDTTNDNVTP